MLRIKLIMAYNWIRWAMGNDLLNKVKAYRKETGCHPTRRQVECWRNDTKRDYMRLPGTMRMVCLRCGKLVEVKKTTLSYDMYFRVGSTVESSIHCDDCEHMLYDEMTHALEKGDL